MRQIPGMHVRRGGIAWLLLALAPAACTTSAPMAPPSVTLEIGGSDFPMNQTPQGPAPPPGGALAAPPLNTQVPAGSLPMPGGNSGPPRSGEYAGSGTVANDPTGWCKSPITIHRWFVSGPNVSFGAFSGTIAPDGMLSMQAGQTYISGQFSGSHFDGRVWQGVGAGCTYSLSLNPV